MSFTGNRDVDIIIVSFCDGFTIANLLSINRRLIETAKTEILKRNDIYDLADLITILIDKREKELAKYFLEYCEKENKDIIDDSEYREILFDSYRPDVLELYFSLTDLNHERLFDLFMHDKCHLDDEQFYNLFEGFYHATKNLSMLKVLMEFCSRGF